jgi:hypothetical protein
MFAETVVTVVCMGMSNTFARLFNDFSSEVRLKFSEVSSVSEGLPSRCFYGVFNGY